MISSFASLAHICSVKDDSKIGESVLLSTPSSSLVVEATDTNYLIELSLTRQYYIRARQNVPQAYSLEPGSPENKVKIEPLNMTRERSRGVRGVNFPFTNDVTHDGLDNINYELFTTIGEAISDKNVYPPLRSTHHKGWRQVLALVGHLEVGTFLNQMDPICHHFATSLSGPELNFRSQAISLLGSRSVNHPVWWTKEAITYFRKHGWDWKMIVRLGDALAAWDPFKTTWKEAELANTRKFLLQFLINHPQCLSNPVPWNESKEKVWLERIIETRLTTFSSEESNLKAPKSPITSKSRYQMRMKLIIGEIGVIIRNPSEAGYRCPNEWVTEGLKIDWLLKGLDPEFMIEIIEKLQVIETNEASFAELSIAQATLQSAIDLEARYPHRSIPQWFNEVYRPNYFQDKFRRVFEKLGSRTATSTTPLESQHFHTLQSNRY
ncbi:hypothetical protein O181_018210 [Austropuccinia psidii MF-1]|uniref:Uncharacterized protein n=1 Tax=Austropuccinia psidii MF-1 TaxID=1389203 RepID=A0A9Q3GTT3_9BASI|nr:hypothetical protein [Austropuccinia psidii MF-1]